MKIEIEDILFWMDAIRNSEDRYRTLESFWKGQIRSKIWLIENMSNNSIVNAHIVIHGGWNGVLASLLFNSSIGVKKITSVDIDPACEVIASTVNKRQEMEGRFTSVTCNMCDYEYEVVPDIVINTSCEHITQKDYDTWYSKIPRGCTVVLQSNNYTELDEHIRCAEDLDEFTKQCHVKPVLRKELDLGKYKRFMIIGNKE